MGTYNANFIFNVPVNRPDVSRRLAGILVSQRNGKDAPSLGRRSGSIDRRSLSRVASGDGRVFKARGEASATRTRFVIIIDCSGSMRGERFANACQSAWDILSAARLIPSASAEVWGHTTGHRCIYGGEDMLSGATALGGGEEFGVVLEFADTNTTLEQFINATKTVNLRGNEDGFALSVIAGEATRTRRSGERIVYVMVSDGQPIYSETNEVAVLHTARVVNSIRRTGDAVISVSVSSSLDTQSQREMYGPGAYVQFTPDTNALIRSFAVAAAKYLR